MNDSKFFAPNHHFCSRSTGSEQRMFIEKPTWPTPHSNALLPSLPSSVSKTAMADSEESSTSPQETRRCCSCAWIVITVEGWVKLIEMVATFLAAVLTLSYPYYRYKVAYEYQVGICTCAFVFVVLHIILRSVHCFEKVMPLLGMIGCFSLSVTLVVGSGIVYDAGKTYVKGDVMIGSGICGFVAAGLFLCEAIFYLFLLVCRRSPPRRDDWKTLTKEIRGPAEDPVGTVV